jgi:hypothetical protein
MPPGWKLFIYRDLIGPKVGPGAPPRHVGRFRAPFACGPTTSSRCGPVDVPSRRVTSPVYEAFRAVVQMPGGRSFEASFLVKWHP